MRQGLRDQISETRKLIDWYQQEEEQYQERMQIRKQVYSNSSLHYADMAERNLLQFKRRGYGNGGGCTTLTGMRSSLSPYKQAEFTSNNLFSR